MRNSTAACENTVPCRGFTWEGRVWRVYAQHVLLQMLLVVTGWVSLVYGWGLEVKSWSVVLAYAVIISLFYPVASAWAKSLSRAKPCGDTDAEITRILAYNDWLEWQERREFELIGDLVQHVNVILRARAVDCVSIQRDLDKRGGFNVAAMTSKELLKAFIVRHSAKLV